MSSPFVVGTDRIFKEFAFGFFVIPDLSKVGPLLLDCYLHITEPNAFIDLLLKNLVHLVVQEIISNLGFNAFFKLFNINVLELSLSLHEGEQNK